MVNTDRGGCRPRPRLAQGSRGVQFRRVHRSDQDGEYLADTLERTGDFARAKLLRERSLAFHESRGPDSLALADRLTAMARLLHAMGDDADARRTVDKAITIAERPARINPPLARALMLRAELLQPGDDQAIAQALLERAVNTMRRAYGPNVPWIADAHNRLADILAARGDLSAARQHYGHALAIATKLGTPEPRWRAAVGLGAIDEQQGRLADALRLYRDAVAAVEALAAQFEEGARRQRYLEVGRRVGVYDALARALLKLNEQQPGRGHDREAMAVLEAKRGRIAAEVLSATRAAPQDPVARSAIDEVRDRHDQALAVERELREEQVKPGNQQDPVKIQELTVLLARTKAEYLDRVREIPGLLTRTTGPRSS